MAWKVIQVILERRLEMCDQPMDTVRPRCTRVKPGKGPLWIIKGAGPDR